MFKRLMHWLRPPQFNTEEGRRTGGFLHYYILVYVLLLPVLTITLFYEGRYWSVGTIVFAFLMLLFANMLIKKNRAATGGVFLLVSQVMVVSFLLVNGTGIRDLAMPLYATVIVIAALLLGKREFILIVSLVIVSVFGILYAEIHGFLVTPFSASLNTNDFIVVGTILLLTATAVWYLAESLRRANVKAVQNEAEMRTREKQYQELVENVNSIIIRWDKDGKIRFMNEFGYSFFGFTGQEILGRSLFESIVPDTDMIERDLKVMIRMILEKPDRFASNYNENTTRDGRKVWIHWNNKAILNEAGEVVEILSVGTDVTQRHHAEEALLLTEERNKALLNANPDLMFVFDRQGVFLDFHAAAGSPLFAPPQFFIGKNIVELFPGRVSELTRTGLENLFRTGGLQVFEYPIDISGKEMFFECRLVQSGPDQALALVRDITEKVIAEQLKEQSEQNYSLLLRNVPGMVYTAIHDWKVEIGNRSEEICGYTREELNGLPEAWISVIHPEDRARVIREGVLSMNDSAVMVQKYRILNKNGQVRWVEDRKTFLLNEADKRIRIYGLVLDITEREESALQLIESEERFRGLVEVLPDMLLVSDLEGNTLYINPAVRKNLGYDRSDFDFKGEPNPYIPAEDRPLVGSAIREVVQAGKNSSELIEYRIIDVRGKIHWLSGLVVRSVMAGKPVIILVSRDITDHKEASFELEEKQSFISHVAEAVPGILYVFDLTKMNFEYINRKVIRFPGTPEEQDTWASDAELPGLIHPDDMKKLEDLLPRFRKMQKGEMIEAEFRMKGSSGEWIWLHSWSIPFRTNGNGEVQHLIGILQEVTESKKKAEELQQKTDEMMRFTYTVSHDLRSPLVTILTFLGFMEQDIESGDKERIHTDVGFIRNAALKMSRLLDELLELSRIGRVMNETGEILLQELIAELEVLLAGRISNTRATITVVERPVVIWGDRHRLSEVFQNLIDNAMKFSRPGGPPCIHIGAQDSDEGIVIFVTDNGKGIDAPYLTKIFGLFEKLDSGGEGTGIGLALVKRIVEVHGGTISARSEGLGKGSTFRMLLPKTRWGD